MPKKYNNADCCNNRIMNNLKDLNGILRIGAAAAARQREKKEYYKGLLAIERDCNENGIPDE